jgi:hypothetical protein
MEFGVLLNIKTELLQKQARQLLKLPQNLTKQMKSLILMLIKIEKDQPNLVMVLLRKTACNVSMVSGGLVVKVSAS